MEEAVRFRSLGKVPQLQIDYCCKERQYQRRLSLANEDRERPLHDSRPVALGLG